MPMGRRVFRVLEHPMSLPWFALGVVAVHVGLLLL